MPPLNGHLKMVEMVNCMLYIFGHSKNRKERKGGSASRPAWLLPGLMAPGDWTSSFPIQPAGEWVPSAGMLASTVSRRL